MWAVVDARHSAPAAARVASWASALTLDEVPDEVKAAAREHVLDTLGCGLAAVGLGEGTAGLIVADESGAGPATAIGRADGVSVPAAALANGMLCHALDFDDTHEASIAHVGAVVVPTALAVAEAVGASGADAMAAIVAGAETIVRIGMAAPEGLHRRGFHPTGVCGVFGATVVACRLRGMEAEATARALGLAGSMASGIFEYLSDGSPTKPLHAGWAAQAGAQAAALTAAGARGPATVLEGRFGLFATHVDVPWDVDAQLTDLGRRWESPSVAIKPYPACHWVHAAVDAAIAACEGATAADIERIVVRIPDVGVPIVLEPEEQKAAPLTPYDAKFSLPWCVAARLVHGRLDVRSFTDEAIADRAVLELAERIEHAPWAGAVVSPFAGEAEVVTRGGRARSVRYEAPRGAPGNPMTPEAVAEKFMVNATRSLDEAGARAVAEAVERLDAADDVRAVTAKLRVARDS